MGDGEALTPGLRVLGSMPRIELSAGIVRAEQVHPALPYREGAFVPRPPWRELRPDELALLGATTADATDATSSAERSDAWMRVLNLPPELDESVRYFREASPHLTSRAQVRALAEQPIGRAAVAELRAYAARFSRTGADSLDGIGVYGNPLGLPTTTMINTDHLIGLHVDNWYPRALADRRRSPNRLSINLGADDRFFLMVNLTVGQIADLLWLNGIAYPGRELSVHGLRVRFMEHFPRYPVLRVRVRPGQALIAPTEAVIHDGCTSGMTAFDVRFSVRGDFRPTPEGDVVAQAGDVVPVRAR